MRKLTPKQEKFCVELVRTNNQSEAYRLSYSTKKQSVNTIVQNASRLARSTHIIARLASLRKEQAKRSVYTLEKSVASDLKLKKMYEDALDVLSSPESDMKQIETAERTIKHIGATGYSQVQDRLSRQHGFYEQDNKQKSNEVTIFKLPDNNR